MGRLLDILLGRSRPVGPDLDQLFAVPSAAVTLQAGAGFRPTGRGSVCFASVEGGAFTRVREEVRGLLDVDVVPEPGAEAGEGPGDGSGDGSGDGAGHRAGGGGDPAGEPVTFHEDGYGYTWLEARHAPDDLAGLVNDVHAVNTALVGAGFGPQLLCSLVGFRDARSRPLGLVYLYKRGTFYPFAPVPGGGQRRDNALELQLRALLAQDLRLEEDLARWFPVWGAPGL